MKNKKSVLASVLISTVIMSACKKEEALTYQPIPPREIQSAFIYQYGQDIPVEGVTVSLKTCNGTMQWVSGGFFGSLQCDEPLEIYRTVFTDGKGSFSFDVDSTQSYEFYKQGYWSETPYGSPNTIDSTPNKHFLIKDAWLKIHFSNTGSPNAVDSIIITAGPITVANSFAYLYLPVYGNNINYISFAKAYGDAANYVKWSTIHNGIQLDSTATFYVNGGDTASVDINY